MTCSKKRDYVCLILLIFLFSWAVGFRPSVVGTDTQGYINHYATMMHFHYNVERYEWLFATLALFSTGWSASAEYLFFLIALVDWLLIVILARQLYAIVKNPSDVTSTVISLRNLSLLLVSFFCLSPFFFAVMVNVIRCGPAILAIFIFNIALTFRRPWYSLILPLLMIAGFHYVSLIAIVFSPLLFLRYSVVLAIALFGCFSYLTGLSELGLQWISLYLPIDIYRMVHDYRIDQAALYKTGIRLNFALFTMGMGAIFDVLTRWTLHEKDKMIFLPFLKIYWVLVLPFFLFGFAVFSDRFLLPGWLFLSVLSAIWLALYASNRSIAMKYWYGGFMLSAVYFILKVQGVWIWAIK